MIMSGGMCELFSSREWNILLKSIEEQQHLWGTEPPSGLDISTEGEYSRDLQRIIANLKGCRRIMIDIEKKRAERGRL